MSDDAMVMDAGTDPATSTVLDTFNAKWYNALTTQLNLSPQEFQLSQGQTVLPQTTDTLWDMMNQLPVASVVQFYSNDPTVSFSSEYTSLLSFVQAPGNAAFVNAMGADNMTTWNAAKKKYFADNPNVYTKSPAELQRDLDNFFHNWALVNLDPGQGQQCYTLYRAAVENPIYIAQELQDNLPIGGPAAFNLTQDAMLATVNAAPSQSLSFNSHDQSSALDNSWATSSYSNGGTYFYTKSGGSDATDFTQTFASADFAMTASYQHLATIPVIALSGETVTADGTSYLPWYYGAALAYAYNNPGAPVWTDPAQWDALFGPNGSMQYVITNLVVVNGLDTTVTQSQTYSKAEQTYSDNWSSEGYGCWPYYVSNSSDNKSTTSTVTVNDSSLNIHVQSALGHPVVIGVTVSSMKDLVQKA